MENVDKTVETVNIGIQQNLNAHLAKVDNILTLLLKHAYIVLLTAQLVQEIQLLTR